MKKSIKKLETKAIKSIKNVKGGYEDNGGWTRISGGGSTFSNPDNSN